MVPETEVFSKYAILVALSLTTISGLPSPFMSANASPKVPENPVTAICCALAIDKLLAELFLYTDTIPEVLLDAITSNFPSKSKSTNLTV